jgi:MoaA/NifB/PqqE/SkfB family radical SAM enzyme
MTITERIDAVTYIPHEYQRPDPPAPRSVKIEVSPRCNYRCGFCALRTRENQPRTDMDFDLFKRITTEMREAGVEEIGVFYLGESTMAPELTERCIRWCKTGLEYPYVFLTSNASLATEDVVEAFMLAGLDSLKWSVNAADREQFAKIMDVKPSLFDKALRNIQNAWYMRQYLARTKGVKTKLYASSIAYDGDQHEKMRELIDTKIAGYVDQHYWLPLYSMGAFATEREEQLGYRPTAGNQGRLGALREPLPCWSAFTEGHVTADGLLSACCFDANSTWVMGDLKEQSFMEAWNSPKFQELRAAHLKRDVTGTICEDCVAYS